MNPLEILEAWLSSIPDGVRNNIVGVAKHFHPDTAVVSSPDSSLFIAYLKSDGLNNREIVYRTLLASKLLDFAFSNKRTEADWTKILDLMLDMKNLAAKEGQGNIHDDMLLKFSDTKEQGLKAYEEWAALRANELDEKQISDWYFHPSRMPNF